MLFDTSVDFNRELDQLAKHGALIGLVSMAVLQLVKDFLFSRRGFQGIWLMRWLSHRAKAIAGNASSINMAKNAEKELTLLATGGERTAFYNLPVEQLCGQVIAAAQAAMDSPKLYSNLVWCLGGASEEENQRRQEISQKPDSTAGPTFKERSDLEWILYPPIQELRRAQTRSATLDLTAAPESAQWSADQDTIDQYKAARNRVSHRIQRSVDGLQIALGSGWKLVMQAAALALSLLIAVLIAPHLTQAANMTTKFEIAAGLIGGFLAPVFRDLLSIVEKFRK